MNKSSRAKSDGQFLLNPDDVLKTIELSDPAVKVLSEELSNDLGKKIIQKLSAHELTLAEIAGCTMMPIQNCDYHVKRLLNAGIINFVGTKIGARGKNEKKYTLSKQSILIVINPKDEDKTRFIDRLKKTALRRFLLSVFWSGLAFFSISLISLIVLLALKLSIQTTSSLPPDVISNHLSVKESPFWFYYIAIALVFGLISSVIVGYLLRRRLVSVKIRVTD